MDEPIFLQALDQEIYKDDQVKSIDQITTEYLGNLERKKKGVSSPKITKLYIDYVDKLYSRPISKDEYGLPPATLMVRPLMPLYKGRQGRNFRRHIQEKLKHDKLPTQFSNLVSTSLMQSKI